MAKTIRICLDKVLRDKGITRYALAKQTNIDYRTVDSYYKNKLVRYDSEILLRLCLALDCEVGDLLKIVNK